eukprot:GFKZ01002514.1.p1 GENE.GFKZ01002514.1~~GFKZ01002514.1.p1  ORF type:complete len:373 (-),score=32.29 GFKZ01002514.1:1010-2128(-)
MRSCFKLQLHATGSRPSLVPSHLWPASQTRCLSTTFAELYRKSNPDVEVKRGDVLKGHIVGRRRPRSSSSQFYIVDFGLKAEVPFSAREIPGASAIGDEVSMPLITLEDDFNEPVFDYEGRLEMPAIQAERYKVFTKTAREEPHLVHGRFTSFKKGGANVNVMGTQAFVPRHHVVALEHPILGSYAPFYLMSVSASRMQTGNGLNINPVASSYGGFLFCLANLVASDEKWEKSGGGSSKERLAYLKLLTRLLVLKNSAVRRLLPRTSGRMRQPRDRRRGVSVVRQAEYMPADAAWLNDLPKGDWKSSGPPTERNEKGTAARAWDRMRRPFPRALQKAKINEMGETRRIRRSPRTTSTGPSRVTPEDKPDGDL